MRSQLNQLPLLSTSNQGMMMVQPQASLCQNSTLMTLLEGPFYYPRRQWGETKGKSHQKSGEDIEQVDGEIVQKLSFILGIGNGKLEEIISYNQLVDHMEAAANEDYEISDDLYKYRALIGHQGPSSQQTPIGKMLV